MTLDQETQDLRALFDWSNAAVGDQGHAVEPAQGSVGNDDLALALKLLACNSRDREQFMAGRGKP